MPLMVAGLMWGLVLVLSLRARRRLDNTMLIAAIVIAASMTTNVPSVYLWAASWLPWPNALDLVANGLLIVGVYYLSSAIRRGATAASMNRGGGASWTQAAAISTVVAMMGTFAFIDNPEPSTNFMLSYGNQPAAAAYSIVQYAYIFSVMLGTLTTCVRNVPHMMQSRFKTGFSLIGVGCSAAMLLCLSVVAMDLSNVLGATILMRGLGGIYDYLYLVTMAFLCVGLSIPPLSRAISSLQLRRKVLAVEPEVRRIWNMTVAKNPSVSLVGTNLPGTPVVRKLGTAIATDGMHRMLVEIHDYLNIEDATTERLSSDDWRKLDEAEALCLQRRGAIGG